MNEQPTVNSPALPVRQVLVHVEDHCAQCGKPYLRMGRADVSPAGQIATTGVVPGYQPGLCSACSHAELAESSRKLRAKQAQQRWLTQAQLRKGST